MIAVAENSSLDLGSTPIRQSPLDSWGLHHHQGSFSANQWKEDDMRESLVGLVSA